MGNVLKSCMGKTMPKIGGKTQTRLSTESNGSVYEESDQLEDEEAYKYEQQVGGEAVEVNKDKADTDVNEDPYEQEDESLETSQNRADKEEEEFVWYELINEEILGE